MTVVSTVSVFVKVDIIIVCRDAHFCGEDIVILSDIRIPL